MGLIRRFMCLVREHVFAAISVKDDSYQYCLRCGTVAPAKVHARDLR